ncbi:MAG: YitT family protein [Anaerolineae bacterium]|nr:YitT family protein [Anaerolineae bacterium]
MHGQTAKKTRAQSFLRRLGRIVLDYLMIAVGAVLVALATDLFFIPNKVVLGGVTGIATILYYLLHTPVGLVTLLINIPLFIAGVLWGGGLGAGLKTIWGVFVMSAAIDLLQPYLPSVTQDPLLYILYGGLLDGVGMGLVFRAGGTTGGTDIIARVAYHLWGIKLGHTLLITNVLILGAAVIAFGVEPVLYAILATYVSSRLVDLVQEGLARSRSAFIISERHAEIRQAILSQLDRGVTILEGKGGYTAQERPVLLCALSQAEVSRLKRLVQEIDPQAFVILFPTSEILGEGFKGFAH